MTKQPEKSVNRNPEDRKRLLSIQSELIRLSTPDEIRLLKGMQSEWLNLILMIKREFGPGTRVRS
jgi:hypothetical protein